MRSIGPAKKIWPTQWVPPAIDMSWTDDQGPFDCSPYVPSRPDDLEFRLRISTAIALGFGPGKAELLRHISETGSITRSAALMKMSYNRAWMLVRDMNRQFREPLVATARGGRTGGGALLTAAGKDVIFRYTRMEKACRKATRRDWEALRRKLRE